MADGEHALDARQLHAWRVFIQMQEHLRSRIEQQLQASSGLSMADYSVLSVLAGAGSGRLRAHELGDKLGWEKSRLHHQLTRMTKRGLVERRAGPARAVHVELTDQGWAALTEAAPRHSAHVRELVMAPLTDQEVDQLAGISAKLLDRFQRSAP
ncbi:MarR family winged helix-turn-helix transcriptional regulator [Paractinoplanes atraurantiacus]|uniref:DNA-binding transcriptional regulator, MarR family n=1 Tax=Paractinoplanes atraurantiacus TaxID=1036182 RepID=A0A285IWW2_9ACTN|nr:MarR family transcriptional regulator [Actinoplanes atraurantiacus]SNY52540.1 DNA-binding transcriptional regulator, MarR family [Actinoplanes atraurantiacus]